MRRLITALALFLPLAANADGAASESAQAAQGAAKSSNASFDKRLPPVLPGETIEGHGQKMKVWSTAGSMAQESAPSAPGAIIPPASIGVVIDSRGRGYHDRKPRDPEVSNPKDPDDSWAR